MMSLRVSQMTNNNSEPGSEHIMTGDWGQLHRGEGIPSTRIILNDTNVMSHTLQATIGRDIIYTLHCHQYMRHSSFMCN